MAPIIQYPILDEAECICQENTKKIIKTIYSIDKTIQDSVISNLFSRAAWVLVNQSII